ncbi:MAG: tetratricopeptide repeat protein, partial [Actinomycetota bacterium]|nr:tetratricopeptide repeat protein [Actinomycetota bacterium]
YFEEGQFSEALDHYFGVLERQPDSAQALARIGWMAYLSGEAEAAASYEREALAIDPGYAEAKWFLANIRLDGLGDRQGAIELLEELVALPELSGDVRAMVEERLVEARRSADG